MSSHIRYAHTNVVARDWRKLSTFYEEVFGCEPIGVERDYSGETVDKLTGMSGIRVRGRHLRLPGQATMVKPSLPRRPHCRW